MPRLGSEVGIDGRCAASGRIQPEQAYFCPVELLILIKLSGLWNEPCRVSPSPAPCKGGVDSRVGETRKLLWVQDCGEGADSC
jgi:hypothetical protein